MRVEGDHAHRIRIGALDDVAHDPTLVGLPFVGFDVGDAELTEVIELSTM